MQLRDYIRFLLDTIPKSSPEKTIELLGPISYMPLIAPYLDVARINSSKEQLLNLIDHLPVTEAAEEGFSIAGLIQGSASHIGKAISTAAITASTVTLINNKDKLNGLIIELKRLKNPKLLMGVSVPLSGGDKYPISKKDITLNDIKEQVDKHLVMLKAVSAFINSSKFHVTTIPDVNIAQWLSGLRSMGGTTEEGKIVSPVLYGRQQLTTTYSEGKWSSKLAKVDLGTYPTQYINPGPMGLSSHVLYAKQVTENLWTLDSSLADSVTNIYNSIDKKRGNGSIKAMFRSTIHTYYSSVLSASMALALDYTHMCEQASNSVITEDKKTK